MLVVTRKLGEKIVIGKGIVLSVVQLKGGQVRLAVEAPREVRILRDELEKHAFPIPGDLQPSAAQPAEGPSSAWKPVAPESARKRTAAARQAAAG